MAEWETRRFFRLLRMGRADCGDVFSCVRGTRPAGRELGHGLRQHERVGFLSNVGSSVFVATTVMETIHHRDGDGEMICQRMFDEIVANAIWLDNMIDARPKSGMGSLHRPLSGYSCLCSQ